MNREVFLNQLANELHKPVIRKFKRLKIFVPDKNYTWACDLVDMQKLSQYNKGYKYLLTIIDCFTRYAWAIPLKTKQGKEVADAFKFVFRNGKPKNLYIDEGGEFLNRDLDKLREQEGINIYHTYSEFKASPIERFNRTLKTIMWKKFTELQTYEWWDMLPELLRTYNSNYHSSIKMKPIDAITPDGTNKLLSKLPKIEPVFIKTSINPGDYVRISRYKARFEKGYTQNWSLEIFQVVSKTWTDPPLFRLKDWKGELIKGSFYEPELSSTKLHDVFLVDKVIRRRKVNGVKQILVSWLGYPEDEHTWIEEKDIFDLHK